MLVAVTACDGGRGVIVFVAVGLVGTVIRVSVATTGVLVCVAALVLVDIGGGGVFVRVGIATGVFVGVDVVETKA